MNRKIYYLAPYEEMISLAKEVLREYRDIEIIHGLLSQGLQKAMELERRGMADVFIARGGTANLLKSQGIKSPIVEMQISIFDVIRAAMEARQVDQRIGLVGFPGMFCQLDVVEATLNVTFEVLPLQVEEDIEGAFDLIQQKQMNVLVGGVICCKEAAHRGIPSFLIKTGKEAILSAGLEALRLSEIKRREESENQQIHAIMDCANEGIMTVDPQGRVAICNRAAAEIIGLKPYEIIGRSASEFSDHNVIQEVMKSKQMKLGMMTKMNQAQVLTNHVPILLGEEVAGVVSTFQNVTKILEYEEMIREELRPRSNAARYTFDDITGNSQIIRQTMEKARKYARSDASVLILGESGTGKEMMAQAIHQKSRHREGPFVAVNCAALPATLLESELFGYEEGAFTGARKGGQKGLFCQADGGTIFLDEISEIPPNLQMQLLRVLQEKEVRPVGGSRLQPVKVRVIAASNRDLKTMAREGHFRQDLYYRLNVLHLQLPPLRHRLEDMKALLTAMEKKRSSRTVTGPSLTERLSSGAIRRLKDYDWPGNIRELENMVERLLLYAPQDSEIDDQLLSLVMETPQVASHALSSSEMIQLTGTLKDMERQIICTVLEREGGSATQAAKRLGTSRTNIWRSVKENQEGVLHE
ncbi:sigma 54-interacting transcriptional regulator [Anoxynatronum sibiricum]|uniref:Sigma 54-interacting transcriptional regulator n=1 Tax=Anoxynatronum sibiricum TaxID=210623 RepID=A0ABU9VYR5_9CLOT